MADQLKTIVDGLNAPPFSKGLNLISFDALGPQQLLQTLSDVVCVIQEVPAVEVRSEAADETAVRLLSALRLLKFRPPSSDPSELSEFRRGLVEGDQNVVWGVLEWLLPRVDELQQRAYLARYLVRVPVPNEFLADPELEALNMEVEQLTETFKEMHREAVAVKREGLGTEDVRKDLAQMEAEREQLGRRLSRVKRKADPAPNRDRILGLATKLRVETEREANLALQKQEQRNGLVHAEQKINRLHQTTKELEEEVESTRPEDLITKLEEENKINQYMVKEKLPKEIATKRKAVQELQRVLALPAMDKADLDSIMKRISDANNEYNKLVEDRNLASDPTEDKLAIFRNQALIVERKKEAAAERLQEARASLAQLQGQVRDKKSRMRDPHGNEVVTSVQFKAYVNKLRGKTNIYKKKRAELQDLRAEIGVLSRTEEILRAQGETLRRELAEKGQELRPAEDADAGPARPERPKTASAGKDVQELREITNTFEAKVEEERRRVETTLGQLRPLRDDFAEMVEIYRTRSGEYSAAAAGLESGYSRLEADVRELRDEVAADERAEAEAETEARALAARSALLAEDGAKAFRDQLTARIADAEKDGQRLKVVRVEETQSETTTDVAAAGKQIKLWRDLLKLIELKQQYGK